MNKKLWIAASALFLLLSVSRAGNQGDFSISLSGTFADPVVLACRTPQFSFHVPHIAGNLRLGVVTPEAAVWGEELENVTLQQGDEQLLYILKDSSVLGKGTITVRVAALSDTKGVVMEIEGEKLPPSVSLFWAFGGCLGKVLHNKQESSLRPEYCLYNVFSIEGGTFTAYYGESMALKVFRGITPMEANIRLSDARRQRSVQEFHQSGKITDAPALTATLPLPNGKKFYLCFHTPHRKADYNYFMLPELFNREYK
ncbi:MAG: DUF4450 domain-containing protein [Bacteroides sp.]|nr:DUF4450 domain-containing protein [Bacteroides sp.]